MSRLMLAAAFTLLAAPAFAAQPKTYQVTGEVSAVTDDMVTVTKGKEKFEIARTADTKTTGELKQGAKVTVEYRMTAAAITAKEAGAAGKKKGAEKKAPAAQ